MDREELRVILDELGLSQAEAAGLLSVDERTVRRWLEDGSRIPGPAQQALRAWRRLHRLGLAWKPEDVPIGEDDTGEFARQIALYRQHAVQLDALLRKVDARGGPKLPWHVDLEENEASLGPMKIGFYRLPNGGFSPSTYRRSDQPPDIQRDLELLEDAYACIAKALAYERWKRKPKPSDNDPVAVALSVINTSTPVEINETELRDAIRNPNTKYRAQARLLINEVSGNVLAGLVARKFVTWKEIANLAKRIGVDHHEKATFIRSMAGIPLGGPVSAGNRPSR